MISKKAPILTLILFSILMVANAHAGTDELRLYSLIDYIGGDYQFAVKNGEIINQDEFAEMTEFADTANTIFAGLGSDDPTLKKSLETLSNKIAEKAPVDEVAALTIQVKKEITEVFGLNTFPLSIPDLSKGNELFAANCTTCHGERGKGNGVLAANLNPAPTNFKDPEVFPNLSPIKAYNTMNFGIEGTAMPAFNTLSDKDKWDVAFFLLSIGFPDEINPGGGAGGGSGTIPPSLNDYKELSSLSNREILESLGEGNKISYVSVKNVRNSLADKTGSKQKHIEYTIAGIASSIDFYKQGEQKKALDKSIEAYLDGYEMVESDLAIANNKLNIQIESGLAKFRSEIKGNTPVSNLETLGGSITNNLNKASLLLEDKNNFTSAVLFTNSFSIIVREALEAILIIAAIIAFLINTGSKQTIRYIHIGWISAIAAGFVTWYLARTVISISGASRELIEGITSILAAAVLFYVSYWLISKIEVSKWKDYIKSKVETALNKKSVIALVSVSFLAVYREAFETVLFYQALGYQAEGNIAPIIWGLLAGLAVTAIIGFLIFKLAIRIPLKYFFSATSLLLYFLCFILIGKGIHELQGAGVIGISFVDYIPRIETLGIYPTLETLIPQAVIVAAFIFASLWIAYVSREKEREEIAVNISHISNELSTMYDSFDHIKGHILEWRRCEGIDMEAEDLDRQIHDVIDHVNQLQTKLGDFHRNVSQPEKPDPDSLN
jgi:high-affinity iron transporter